MFKFRRDKHDKGKEETKPEKAGLRGVIIDDDDELMIIYSEEIQYSCATCPLRGICGR
jgi:hypothetical protein